MIIPPGCENACDKIQSALGPNQSNPGVFSYRVWRVNLSKWLDMSREIDRHLFITKYVYPQVFKCVLEHVQS